MKIKGLKTICVHCHTLVRSIAPQSTTEYDECYTRCKDCVIDLDQAPNKLNERRSKIRH